MATALITGGTSGIGNTFAHQMAARGDDLVLVARDTARLEKVADELRTTHGVHVEVMTADLAVRDDVLRVAGRLEDPARPIDILVNNAGFGLHSSLLDNLELHERALDVMCLAVLVLGGAAGRSMKARGKGQIINVSSTAGLIYTGNYSAVKSWCTSYSQGLYNELRGTGVSVTALLPGWVRTEFHERAGINAGKLPGIVWIDADVLVAECLADADKGKAVSIPTWRWKVAGAIAPRIPQGVVRWFSRQLSKSRQKG